MHEAENLLNFAGPANAVWSTANAGEAMPGSLTPLNWTIFGTVAEIAIRHGFNQVGALSRKNVCVPENRHERCIGIFFGHAALKVDFLCEMGSRMPGMSGEAVAMQLLGSAPPGLPNGAQIWRYPIIALRLPWQWLTLKRKLDAMVRRTSPDWWRASVRRAPMLSHPEAIAQLKDGYRHFLDANLIQTVSVLAAIQPAFEALSKLISKAKLSELRGDLMAGYGSHVESAMVYDMWAISRGRLTVEAFLDAYGFHGPREGEISGKVWREDPAPLRRLIDGYRRLGEEADPSRLEAVKVRLRLVAEEKLLSALPWGQRPAARLVMRAASYFVPMRGIGKMAFLSALDVLRATARRIGQCLVEARLLDDPNDVFYLTYDELIGPMPTDARRLVGERRSLVDHYANYTLPRWWQGPQPEPIESKPARNAETAEVGAVLRGIGASVGVIEGFVEVVTNPDFADVPDDRILVAPTTDPSWVPLMYLSKALVVDIGGELSHAAVVARELGIPCVVGTNHGSRALRSGDFCRVDGGAGTVEVLRRAPS